MPVDADTITQTAHFLSSGSVAAVVALLLAIIAWLIWERLQILKKLEISTKQIIEEQKEYSDKFAKAQNEFSEKIAKIYQEYNASSKEMSNTYHQSILQVTSSLNELRNMMGVIRTDSRI